MVTGQLSVVEAKTQAIYHDRRAFKSLPAAETSDRLFGAWLRSIATDRELLTTDEDAEEPTKESHEESAHVPAEHGDSLRQADGRQTRAANGSRIVRSGGHLRDHSI